MWLVTFCGPKTVFVVVSFMVTRISANEVPLYGAQSGSAHYKAQSVKIPKAHFQGRELEMQLSTFDAESKIC